MKANRAREAGNFFAADAQAGIGPFIGVFLQAEGTGRVNGGQGVVMTVPGAGAALSPAPGSILARCFDYPAAFIAPGAISTGSLALWLGFGAGLRHACRAREDAERHTSHVRPR
jgi:hypothetical protein